MAPSLHYIGSLGGYTMFHIKSLDEQGFPLEVVNEQPAFFALYQGKQLIGYFISIEACQLAAQDLRNHAL